MAKKPPARAISKAKQTVSAPYSTSKTSMPPHKKGQNVSGSPGKEGGSSRKANAGKTKQPAVRAKRPAPKTPNGNAGRTSYSYQ